MTVRFGPVRKMDWGGMQVCNRCGAVFLPMVIEDPSDDEAATECPVCDLPRRDVGDAEVEQRE